MLEWTPWLKGLLLGAWILYLLVLGMWVILQKRAPVATLSWILVLALLPYVGFLIFYFLGPQRMRKRSAQYWRTGTRQYLSDEMQAMQARTRNAPAALIEVARLGVGSNGIYPCSAQQVRLLTSGADTFDAILAAIAQAKHHVHLEYYIYEPDQTGTRLRDLLVQKAQAGVKVRLLLDALGSSRINAAFLRPLRQAGGEVALFNTPRLGRRGRPVINYRTHRKIVVCDGHVAFTGGVNITDEEDQRIRADAYHDMHLAVEGNLSFWLQFVFLEDWCYANNMRFGDCVPDWRNYLHTSEVGKYDVQLFASGPNTPQEPIHRVMVEAIHAARDRVWLTTPYFVPTEAAMMALTSAAYRGVDVQLMVPRQSDSKFVTLAARSYFDELTEAGVRIWEYESRMLHSKTMLVDHSFGLVGTANFDIRSFRLNYEVAVGVYNAEFVTELAEQFEKDIFQSRCVARMRFLPLHSRLAEALARLASPLL